MCFGSIVSCFAPMTSVGIFTFFKSAFLSHLLFLDGFKLKVIHYWNYYFITVEGFARVPQPNLWYTVAMEYLYLRAIDKFVFCL